jgi:hypothetical protein
MRDIDAARVAGRIENVADVGVPEAETQRLARRQIQQRFSQAARARSRNPSMAGRGRPLTLADRLVET